MGALHKTTAVFLCDPLNFQKQVLHFCLFRVYIYEIFFWGDSDGLLNVNPNRKDAF